MAPTADLHLGKPCLNCKKCHDGFAQHMWRKSCRNCFCKREDHGIGTAAGQSESSSVSGRKGLGGRIAFNTIVKKPQAAGEDQPQLQRTGKKWVRPPPAFADDTRPEVRRPAKKWSQSTPSTSKTPSSAKASVGGGGTAASVAQESANLSNAKASVGGGGTAPSVAQDSADLSGAKASVGGGGTAPSVPQDSADLSAGVSVTVDISSNEASSEVNFPVPDDLPPPPPEEEDLPPPPPPPADEPVDEFGLDDALADIMLTVDSFGKKPASSDAAKASNDDLMPLPTQVTSAAVSETMEQTVPVPANKWNWVPEGLSEEQVGRFMAALPEDVRPSADDENVQHRARLQLKQRPPHDFDSSECNPMSKEDEEELAALVKEREQQKGTGKVQELTVGQSCAYCQGKISVGELAVHVGQLGDKAWHPGCFKCKTCDLFLVNLVYYHEGDHIYCARHCAELTKPRCAGCDELILSGAYTKAQERNWHTNHFCCIRCDKPLAVDMDKEEYVKHDGQVVCMSCYNTSLAKKCAGCDELIGPAEEHLSHDDGYWHKKCFSCSQCKVDLDPSHFLEADSKLLCETCYTGKFSDLCVTCQQPIKPGEQAFSVAGKKWHEKCFCCVSCKSSLAGGEFFDHSSGTLCGTCYHGKHSSKCDACNQPLGPEGGLNYDGKTYHSSCFVCIKCNADIGTRKFISRDEGFICEDCYLSGVAPQCAACHKAITSDGGNDTYTAHEGKVWHDACFHCEQCAKPLVAASFLYRNGKLNCMSCASTS